MSIRVDTSPLIAGAVVVGDPGLGVLGSQVPPDGEHGGGIASTWLGPEDANKEVRVLITSWPTTGTLFVYEDTSFEYDGESTTFAGQLYLDGDPAGSPQPVTLTIGGDEVTLTISDAGHAQDATAVALTAGLALTVADALHAQQAGSPTLTAAHTLNVAASLHTHAADQLPVSAALTLAVAAALHAQSAERRQLTYPGLFAQDDFFGSAAGTELSAHNAQWVRASGIGSHQLFINAAELLYITGVTSGNGTYYIGASPGSSDYEVSTNVVFLGPLSTSGPSLGVIGRFLTASPNTFYFAMYQASTDTWRLTKFVSGTATLLGAVAAGAVAGTSRRLSLRMLGSSLSVLVDGVVVITATDTSITSAGAAGVRFNPFAAPDVIALDNFAARTLSGVAADLSTNNALHAHTAQTPTLGSTHTVVTSSATHGHTTDATTLSAQHSLVTSNAAHAHAAGSLTLSVASPVVSSRPEATVSAGSWTPSSGSELHAMINEAVPDDGTYIYATTPTITRLALGEVSLPAEGARTLKFRAWSPSSAGGLVVRLYQGAMLVATRTYATLPAAAETQSITLTGAESELLTSGVGMELELEAIE